MCHGIPFIEQLPSILIFLSQEDWSLTLMPVNMYLRLLSITILSDLKTISLNIWQNKEVVKLIVEKVKGKI